MKERLIERLEELKIEYKNGEKLLIDIERRKGELEYSLIRINGAVQVLEEVLRDSEKKEDKSEIIGINGKHKAQI